MAVEPPRPRDDSDRDHIVVLRDYTWAQYVTLSESIDRRPKVAFLDGSVELVTTSRRHELAKKLIGRLLETYAVEQNIELTGTGEMTVRNTVAEDAAAEPDESYYLGALDERPPDLAIEVVITSGGIDKLEVYRRLGVREVWFWIDGCFWLYALTAGKYREVRASALLPGFDHDAVTRLILRAEAGADQTSIVRAYRDSLHGQA